MMAASKFLFDDGEDEEVFNDEWAASGSLDLKDLNKLEREFLSAMDWHLFVTPDEFFEQLSTIETLVTWNQTRKRVNANGFTYNEIVSLAFEHKNIPEWLRLSDNFLKMIMITSVTYSAIVLSVFGATLVACSFHCMLSNSLASSLNTTEPNNSLDITNEPLFKLIASSLPIGALQNFRASFGLFEGNQKFNSKERCQRQAETALPRLVSYFNHAQPKQLHLDKKFACPTHIPIRVS
jgi:hypothetical protein